MTEYGGNPNLLWDMQVNNLVVIDHNQAFDLSFSVESFLSSHVFADHWNDVFCDHVRRSDYEKRLKDTLSRLPDIHDSIPGSWWFVDDGVSANITWQEIVSCLERCVSKDFWGST